jgi:hypothetical protein
MPNLVSRDLRRSNASASWWWYTFAPEKAAAGG